MTIRLDDAPDSGLIRRKDVIDLLSRLANDHAGMALYGEPDSARSREAMEAAFSRVKHAVAFLEPVALTPRADREAIARVIEDIARRWIYRTAHNGSDHLCGGIGNEAASAVLALGVLHPSREVISDRDHLQTAWDALLREIETLQRATNYDPHPDDEINVSLTVAQAHALEEVADAALSARVVSHPPLSAIAEAERALEKCRDQFRHYADLHKAKGTIDGDEKAFTNAAYTFLCDETLTALRAIPAMTGAADPRNREEATVPSQPNGWRDGQCIWFHGTNADAADAIMEIGFRAGTYFARHLEDAIEFGGPCVFYVRASFSMPEDAWQVRSSKPTGIDSIEKYVHHNISTLYSSPPPPSQESEG